MWGGKPPASNSLQSHISGLRGVLGRDAIAARPPGYVLELGPDGTDVQAAERLLAQAAAAAGPAGRPEDLRAQIRRDAGELGAKLQPPGAQAESSWA